MKKWTKILCCVFMICFLAVGCLTGCATVSNIKNNNKEVLYFGNSAVVVGNHLYFGNAFADETTFTGKKSYKNGAEYSYLARVNTSSLNAKSEYYSPKKVENVSEEVVGHSNNFMFVLGKNIYYATPNKQKVSADGSSDYNYNFTSIYKSQLNGNKKKKIFTTSAEVEQIEVLKCDGKYFLVIFAGDELVKINLSNNKSQKIASGVSSVAMPKTYEMSKEGSTIDFNGYIYYTTALEVEGGSGNSGNVVNRVKLSGGDSEAVYSAYTDIKFLDREKDIIFFSETNTNAEIFVTDATNDDGDSDIFRSNGIAKRILTASTISDVNMVCTTVTESDGTTHANERGYVFMNGSDLVFFDLKTRKVSEPISLKLDDADLASYSVLFVNGTQIFLATTSEIVRADLSKVLNGETEIDCVSVVKFSTAQIKNESDMIAFDGQYVYFYATLEPIPSQDEDGTEDSEQTDEEQEDTTGGDEKYYLYRAHISKGVTDKSQPFQLLGKTTTSVRHS